MILLRNETGDQYVRQLLIGPQAETMMNCPKCGNAITKLGRYCGSCKYDFGEELFEKFTFYFGLKGSLTSSLNCKIPCMSASRM